MASILVIFVCIGIYQTSKPLPAGLSFAGPLRPVNNIQFYRDLTWIDSTGKRQTDHEIFDHILTMIKNARRLIILDMFLFLNSQLLHVGLQYNCNFHRDATSLHVFDNP